MESTHQVICPRCNDEIPAGAPMGLCPGCLIQMYFDTTEPVQGGEPSKPSSCPPSIGRCIGRYDLLELLDQQGGMGMVYRARNTETGEIGALKMLRSPFASDVEVYLFRKEMEVLAKLREDGVGIVPMEGHGEHEAQPYFTMKLMRGGSLARPEHMDRLRQAPREA